MFRQTIDQAFEESCGPDGARRDSFARHLKATSAALDTLRRQKESGALPMLQLPYRTDDIPAMDAAVKALRAQASRLIVIGTGGSSLGAQSLAALEHHPFAASTVCVLDNPDPHTLEAAVTHLDLADTAFLAVSKSGSTVETLSALLVMAGAVEKKLGKDAIAHRFAAITIPGSNPLRDIAQHFGMRVLDHDPAVGGRFSVLSCVGLIPALFAGVDIRAVRRGAAWAMDNVLKADGPASCDAAIGAALNATMIEQGKDIAVVMPYADRLNHFGLWFRQLWAESLGKEGKGSTPIYAMGTVDQHSQLQLYLDGPRDKLISFVLTRCEKQGPPIPLPPVQREALSYLAGKTIGDVFAAEQRATAQTLLRARCPIRLFEIDSLSEEPLGALLMHFMLETIITAHLLGIDAFDQPAVEESKVLARQYLAGNGQ